jgi:uncharacterized protein (TIGR00297 family)
VFPSASILAKCKTTPTVVLVLAMLKVDCKSQRGVRPEAGEEMQVGKKDTGWKKAISRARDGRQSKVLVWVVVPVLVWATVLVYRPRWEMSEPMRPLLFPLLFSFGFAAVVWLLRSATLPAAGVGLLVCLILARVPGSRFGAIPAVIVLFGLTFAATRVGRARKERRGLAEPRSGRRASQIVANLGVAALCAAAGWYGGCIAALAESAADTVSSEVGQALGGRTWLLTTFRYVPAGKDGGVSVAGTTAGVAAAGLVVWAGGRTDLFWLLWAAACAGLIFDSLLGATVEERGWVGNDLVNFGSTLFAALLGGVLTHWRRGRF